MNTIGRNCLKINLNSPAIVIGKDGKTLESLQYLATLSISRHFEKPISVVADTQNYWRRAEDKINAELEVGLEKIKNGYSVYRFRPMSAQLRRYIHRAAENNEFAITVSEGEGQWRKVTLRPRPADQAITKSETNTPATQPAETTVETAEVEVSAAVEVENTPTTETVTVTEVAGVVESAPTETVAGPTEQIVATPETVATTPQPASTTENK